MIFLLSLPPHVVGSFGRKVILVHQKIITYITKVFLLKIHSAQPIDKPAKLIKFFVFFYKYRTFLQIKHISFKTLLTHQLSLLLLVTPFHPLPFFLFGLIRCILSQPFFFWFVNKFLYGFCVIITTCEDDAGAAEILMVASYIPSDYFLTARKYLLIFKIFHISAHSRKYCWGFNIFAPSPSYCHSLPLLWA